MNNDISDRRMCHYKTYLIHVAALCIVLLFAFMCWGCGGDDNGTGPEQPVTVELITTDDTFVFSQDPDEAYNDGAPSCPSCGAALRLSPSGGHTGESRLLLRYSLDQIPTGSTILSASLRFKDLAGSVNNSSDCVNFEIQSITTVWSEYTATWNNQPNYFDRYAVSGSLCGETFDVSVNLNVDFLQDIVDGHVPNRGFVVMPTGTGTYGNHHKVCASREGDGKGIPLTIKYQK